MPANRAIKTLAAATVLPPPVHSVIQSTMQKIEKYLKTNQSRFVEELCEYVKFPSVSAQAHHRPDMQACADWVVNHCRQIGLEARVHPTKGHPVVVAKTPRRDSNGAPRKHF